MIEIAIFSGIGATLGVVKQAVDLFTSIRQILPKKEKPSPETLAMLDGQKAAWKEINDAMIAGAPVADRIIGKLAWKYGVVLIIAILLLIGIGSMLVTTWTPSSDWFWMPILVVSGFAFISWFFKNPLTPLIQDIDAKLLWRKAEKLISLNRLPTRLLTRARTDIATSFQTMQNVFGRLISISLLTNNERTYLTNYVQLCALRDSIETLMIKELIAAAQLTTQTGFRDRITVSLSKAIEKFLETNGEYKRYPEKGPEYLQRYLEAELARTGFDPGLANFNEHFYRRIFSAPESEPRSKWIDICIKSFWHVPIFPKLDDNKKWF
jgi:hypothetical protein